MRVDLKTLQRTLRRKSIQIMAQQNNNSRIELIFSLSVLYKSMSLFLGEIE